MINPWFITGFCDGEATFTYSRSGNNINLYFAIKLNAEDRQLINSIFDFFGVGRIYEVKPRAQGPKSGNTRAAVYYRVTKISELAQIIRHFDKYPLQGKKVKGYKVWKDMFLAKSRFRKTSFPHLSELALELSKLTSRNSSDQQLVNG